MAQGSFSMDEVVFSDREVNYAINRRYSATTEFANMNPLSNNLYDNEANIILSPGFSAAGMARKNFDGSAPYDISGRVVASTQVLTAQTPSRGIWTAITSGTSSVIGDYRLDSNKYIGADFLVAAQVDGTQEGFNSAGVHEPTVGNLMYVRWRPPTSAKPNENAAANSQAPVYSQWYRVRDYNDPSVFFDRNMPDFGSGSGYPVYWIEYPFSATTAYWNSGTTAPGDVWSFSIVRTNHVMGTTTDMVAGASGYTSYASKEFNGTKRFFGLNDTIGAVGFAWHEDAYTGQTYGDLLMPNTTQLDLPDVMWHRQPGVNPGQATRGGHRFTDQASDVFFDEAAKTNYTVLYDGIDPNKIPVGRVYYELRLIMITDQELLTAMSYKSNRNFTLPKLRVELSEIPAPGTTVPVISEGNTYYFSYYMHANPTFAAETSYGFKESYPCANWTIVEGQNSSTGAGQYPVVSLDPGGFPYMRVYDEFEAFSGTGWVGNVFQLLFNELDTSQTGATGVDKVRPNVWQAVDDAEDLENNNGVYVGEPGETTINPNFMGTRVLSFGTKDIGTNNGVDVALNSPNYIASSATTTWTDTVAATGLTWGDEMFLNGNVKTVFGLRTEKLIATVSVGKDELNASKNGRFKGSKDLNTYITEVGVFNADGDLVAVGKPTYPIRKNAARHLLFQLEVNI